MSSTILIVEDEFAVARGIQYALQQEGYQVAVAKSGEEGLDFATNQAPDLVVLDVRLPGMDGFEVLRRLRASGSKAPVLVLTARDDEVRRLARRDLEALFTRSRDGDLVALLLEGVLNPASDRVLVFDDEDGGCHAGMLHRRR